MCECYKTGFVCLTLFVSVFFFNRIDWVRCRRFATVFGCKVIAKVTFVYWCVVYEHIYDRMNTQFVVTLRFSFGFDIGYVPLVNAHLKNAAAYIK